MSMTLFFAKLNLVSDDIFKLYDNPRLRKEISNGLRRPSCESMLGKRKHIY